MPSTASASDVREIIDTSLTDSEIDNRLDEARFWNQKYNDESNQTTEETTRIEAYTAAILIRQDRDRAHDQQSAESRSVSLQGKSLSQLTSQLSALDPSGNIVQAVAFSAVQDTNRHTNTTSQP